ncbi:cytochrome P450 [Stipitochalara longipes BDJ]|nr:cytochrome P450 [Stipitochalara longipes BDJ]
MGLATLCCYAVAAGVTAHLGYFIHGERHEQAPATIALSLIAPILIFWIQLVYLGESFVASAFTTTAVSASFAIALWMSMVIYRLFFHPLRHFPGPVGAKISKFWHSYNSLPRLDGFRWLDRMYHEYGDFVRTGPNEIAIFDPAAVSIILGPGSRCIKGPFYDITKPLISVQTTRDKQVHAKRRRVWDKGFGMRALRTYQQCILQTSNSLVRAMSAHANSIINANECAIAFGKSFGTVETGKGHFILQILAGSVKPFALLGPVPWLFGTLARLPGSPFEKFVEWCANLVDERRKVHEETEISDVMSNLIEDYNKSEDKAYALNYLHGDSRLIVLAGTETTAGTLTHLFYFLASQSSKQALLRAELSLLVKNTEDVDFKALQDAPMLNGVISETLRLWPPVLSGLQYTTPPEGITIKKTYIPGNVTVYSPSYTVQRLESCFVNGNEFIPERWFSRPELISNKVGYAPFSLGQQSCTGKQLALLELRTIVALLVTKFNINFAPGDDGKEVVENLTDHFAATPGKLKLIFTPV